MELAEIDRIIQFARETGVIDLSIVTQAAISNCHSWRKPPAL